MRLHVLGSAAGGGIPQWNCGCNNCHTAREDLPLIHMCTQSSVVVSTDGKRWILLNASPDIHTQIISFRELAPPKGTLRGSAIDAVVLTDGEMDHVVGLLSLREQAEIQLICTPGVRSLLTDEFPLLRALQNYCSISYSTFPCHIGSITILALNISGKNPHYASVQPKKDSVVGIKLISSITRKIMVYMPCLPAITDEVNRFVKGCDCLLVDGTFWSDYEMISLGITRYSANDMGHVPIDGKNGSLAWLHGLDIPKKIYVHINNTNPIIRKTSSEREIVNQAGIKVGYDGMDINLNTISTPKR